jgi:hypothetical protein
MQIDWWCAMRSRSKQRLQSRQRTRPSLSVAPISSSAGGSSASVGDAAVAAAARLVPLPPVGGEDADALHAGDAAWPQLKRCSRIVSARIGSSQRWQILSVLPQRFWWKRSDAPK